MRVGNYDIGDILAAAESAQPMFTQEQAERLRIAIMSMQAPDNDEVELVAGVWTVFAGERLGYAMPFGVDWAVEREWLRAAIMQINAMGPSEFSALVSAGVQQDYSQGGRLYKVYDGVAHVPFAGLMTKRPTCMGSMFGGQASTLQLRQSLRAADADPSVQSKLLVIDSPGGEVSGAFDAAKDVMRGKPTDTLMEDMAASGGQLLAVGGRQVFVNDNGMGGSVGVYTQLHDDSEGNGKNGRTKVHVVKAGKYKAIGDPSQPVTDEHIRIVQQRVDYLHGLFLRHVAKARGNMTKAQLAEVADAGIYVGRQAVKVGLADDVGDIDAAHRAAVAANKENRRKVMAVTDPQLRQWLGDGDQAAVPAPEDNTPRLGEGDTTHVMTPQQNAPGLADALAAAGIIDRASLGRVLADAKIGAVHRAATVKRAKELAVSVFGVDTVEGQMAVEAAEAYLDSAPHTLVEMAVTQYEAQLRGMGMAAAEGRERADRITAPQDDTVAVDAEGSAANEYVSRTYTMPVKAGRNGDR